MVAMPALAEDLGEVAGRDQPGVLRARPLTVNPIAFLRFVPVDEAILLVANALRMA